MAEVVKGFKPTIYRCSKCGITSETHRAWGPICPAIGRRVCDICCWKCADHISWSGIWKCGYRSPEEKRAAAVSARKAEEAEEIRKISKAYQARRREEAKLRAIKSARAKAKRKSY